MKAKTIQTPAYDVSGGNTNFDIVPFEGNSFIAVQFYYTSLNQANHKLRLQESIDGVNFLDSLDSSGNNIEITIDNSIATDILKAFDFNTSYIRFQFVEGTTGTGTFDKLNIVME